MKKLTMLAAASALLAGSAVAQVSGSLGTDSTADVTINATVDPMVRISGLDGVMDFTLDAATLNSNFGNTRQTQRFCVYSNVNTTGDYNVAITGTPSGDTANPFRLLGSGSNALDFTVAFTDDFASPFKFIHYGTSYPRATTTGGLPRPTDTDCGNVTGGENTQLAVTFRNSEVLSTVADTYTGALTITVSAP
ncbi:MAG: hypothetical protein RIB03_12840 [Henriciella sp.]|uniref:hypothetical protein n=1 Tax=Henriciella sp. TaxID=1968823 RepID=UPI0032ED7275